MPRPRIRSIKPEFFRDEKVQRMPRDARLLMLGLITLADDEGRLDGHAGAIRSAVFPHDDLTSKQVAKWLQIIADQGLIHRYATPGFEWIEIRNWAKHQKVNRPTPSRIPSYQSVSGDDELFA